MIALILAVLAGVLLLGVLVERVREAADRADEYHDRLASHRRLMIELARYE